MKDWTQDIPGNVSQIKIRYTIITRDHGHRRREVFDTLQEAHSTDNRKNNQDQNVIKARQLPAGHCSA